MSQQLLHQKKTQLLMDLGCDEVVDYSKHSFQKFLEESKDSFDIILDCVGDAPKVYWRMEPRKGCQG